jgi:hypothetical protein
MPMKWRRAWGILAIVVLIAPLMVGAQEERRGNRGDIQVTNDWEDTVRVTLWKERGEQMSRQSWTIPQGLSVILASEDGRPLRVRGYDKIKVGDDWGRVNIETVGQLQGGLWNVSVRHIWRATHQRRGHPGSPFGQRHGLLPDQGR